MYVFSSLQTSAAVGGGVTNARKEEERLRGLNVRYSSVEVNYSQCWEGGEMLVREAGGDFSDSKIANSMDIGAHAP